MATISQELSGSDTALTVLLSAVSVMGMGGEAGRQCSVRVCVRELLIRSQGSTV